MTSLSGRAAALLVTAVAVTSCGGSSLSDLDLRADATALCQAANTRSEQLPAPRSPPSGAAFLRRGASELAHELAALRALAPPSDLAARYGAAVHEFAAALADVRATIAGIDHGADPSGAFRALELQLAPVLTQEDEAWRALQIPACVSR
jgi:hypothetical protein